MATNCRAIAAGGRTKSTTPAAIALFGMPSYFAVSHFLSEGDASGSLDRLEAQRPIRRGSRQNDAKGPAAAVRRQGAEKASIGMLRPLSGRGGVSRTPSEMPKLHCGGIT